MQDIRKKHLNSKSNYPVTREIHARGDTTISHAGLSGTEQRRPRFVKSDEISVYRNPMGNRESYQEGDDSSSYESPRTKNGSSFRKIKNIFSYLFIFAIVFSFYYVLTYVFDHATVTVVPNYKDLNLPVTPLTLGDKGRLPFEIATTEVNKTKTLPKTMTTTVDKKASGQITIYNNYGVAPQRLVKFTRFESTANKIYKIQYSIIVPGKKGDTPGQITVKVIAESEGSEYNLDADSLTIPGFKGKDQFTKIYAKTATALSGGASGSKAIVALTDLNAAKDELAVKLRDAVTSEFKAKKFESKIPILDSIRVKIEDNASPIMRGEDDTYAAKGIGSIAILNGSDLGKVILGGDASKALTYTFLPSKNLSITLDKDTPFDGTTSLSIIMSGNARIIWNTDYNALQTNLVSKSKKDFATVITNDKTISSATISIFPPWKTSLPSRKDAITVKEKLPEYKL